MTAPIITFYLLLVLLMGVRRAHGFIPIAPNAELHWTHHIPHSMAFSSRPQYNYLAPLSSLAEDSVGDGIIADANWNENNGFFIKEICSSDGALDVPQLIGIDVDSIKKHDDDDDGSSNIIQKSRLYEPEIYFVAIFNGTKIDGNPEAKDNELGNDDASPRENHIMGAVSSQLRHRAPLIAGPSSSSEGDSSTSEALPSVPLPTPHVYAANMLVDVKMRRRGVGTALLSSVMEYANSWSDRMEEKIPIVLSVDHDNTGARAMYERAGFEYLEQNSVFCMMVLW